MRSFQLILMIAAFAISVQVIFMGLTAPDGISTLDRIWVTVCGLIIFVESTFGIFAMVIIIAKAIKEL